MSATTVILCALPIIFIHAACTPLVGKAYPSPYLYPLLFAVTSPSPKPITVSVAEVTDSSLN